jgi:hypothetical protein
VVVAGHSSDGAVTIHPIAEQPPEPTLAAIVPIGARSSVRAAANAVRIEQT